MKTKQHGWEWCVTAVTREDMDVLGLSWYLSCDSNYMDTIGGVRRLGGWGWALELYRWLCPDPPRWQSLRHRQ